MGFFDRFKNFQIPVQVQNPVQPVQPVQQSYIRSTSGSAVHKVGWVALLAFTGTCTFLLLQKYAPPTAPWLPWAGLTVFEFGVIHWLHYHRHSVQNGWQWLISLIMTLISVGAVGACTYQQLSEWFSRDDLALVIPWVQENLFRAIIAVFVLNVLAYVGCDLLSPEQLNRQKIIDMTPNHIPVSTVIVPEKTIESTLAPATLPQTATVQIPATTQQQNTVSQEAVMDALANAGFAGTKIDDIIAALKASQGAQQADPQTAPLTDQANQ